jgi:hypothetical protein
MQLTKADFRRIKRQAIRLTNRAAKAINKGTKRGLKPIPTMAALRRVRDMRLRDCDLLA